MPEHRPSPPIAGYLAQPHEVHRVVLLYSGGLDTSVMLKWIQDEYDAEVHVVSRAWIDEWRTRLDQGYVEVIEYDGRTDAERTRFVELEQRVVARLTAIGRSDLIAVVDTNIFGASLDPDLPADIVADLAEMLLIGEPVAVFIAPAGSTF